MLFSHVQCLVHLNQTLVLFSPLVRFGCAGVCMIIPLRYTQAHQEPLLLIGFYAVNVI